MSVQTPPFFGLILRKNERTHRFIEQQIENLVEMAPDARAHLNEDEHLIAFSVAMNGLDLHDTIEELEEQQAVYGEDFVATGSPNGVLGDMPAWLSEKTERVAAVMNQPTKFYSFVPLGEAAE